MGAAEALLLALLLTVARGTLPFCLVDAWAGLPRLKGLPGVALPRVATLLTCTSVPPARPNLAAGGGFWGNFGRTSAMDLPVFSRRSGLIFWSTGRAESRIAMVGILVREALAIVFGSMPLFTMLLFRTTTLLMFIEL
jgi:hypothetical protein